MISNIHAFTPTGKIKRPSYSTVATWVKESWDEVDETLSEDLLKVVEFQQTLTVQKMIAFLITIYWIM